jgi:LacI family transcriptional regulator
MVTSRDVARAAGVSQTTVSRVLRDSDHVRPETRDRVLAALANVGYRPNAHARAMRTGRVGAIGIVMERITNPFYPELLVALAEVLVEQNQRIVLWLAEGAAESGAVQAIHEGTVDGIIFTTVREGSGALQEAIDMQAPFVLVNRTIEGLRCDQVASDNFEGAAAVARYFANYGRDKLAVIGGLRGVSTNDERCSGFVQGASEAGLAVRARNILMGDFTEDHGYQAFKRLMASKNPPNAIFCVNDLLAFGVLNSARALGIKVPEELWLVGYDDTTMSSWQSHDLTTVRQRLDDMARAAVELVLDRIEHPEGEPTTLRFPSRLIIRGSTDRQPFTGAAKSGKPPENTKE